jgi:autotransporter-associated beta strand protein
VISGTGGAKLSVGPGALAMYVFDSLNSNAELTITPEITGTGGINKQGGGKLVLMNANSYSGGTTVGAGILSIGDAGAMGSGPVSVGYGASLELQNNITVDGAITLAGLGAANTGALRNLSGGNVYAGAITLSIIGGIQSDAGLLTLSNAAPVTGANVGLTLSGAGGIELQHGLSLGIGSLTKNDEGMVLIDGTASYTGATTVNGGILRFIEGRTFSGAVTINGSTTSGGSAKLDLNGQGGTIGALTFGAYAGVLANSVSELALGTTGTLNLTGNVTYTGVGAPEGALISDGGTSQIALGSGLHYFIINDSTATTAELTVAPKISGTGSINKLGLGTLLLTNTNNTYTGNITVTQGILSITNSGALGTGGTTTVLSGASLELQSDLPLNEALILSGAGANGTGALRNLSGTNTILGSVTLAGATTFQSDLGLLTLNNGSAITGLNTSLTFGGNGNIELMNGLSIGAGGVTKNNNGTTIIDGTATFSGATTVTGGTLRFTSLHNFGAVTISAAASGGSATLDLAGQDGTMSTLLLGSAVNGVSELALGGSGTLQVSTYIYYTGAGNPGGAVISGSGTSELSVGSSMLAMYVFDSLNTSAELTVAPKITGTGGINKLGTGTLVLTGASTYTGTTTVGQGNLQVGNGGTGSTGQSAVSVSYGATLSGSGRVGGVVGVTNHVIGGTLAPGDQGGVLNGTLTVDGNMSVTTAGSQIVFGITNATGVYGGNLADLDFVHASPGVYQAALNDIVANFGVGGPAAVSDHDFLDINGTLTLSAAMQITVNNIGGTLALGNAYNLIDANSILGTTFNTGGAQRNGGLLGDLSLPTLAIGLKWDTTKFLSDGLLVIVDPPIFWKGGNTTAGDPTSWNNGSNWLYEDGSEAGSPNGYTEVVLTSAPTATHAPMTLNQDVTIKKLTVTDTNATTVDGTGTISIKPLTADGTPHDAITVASNAGTVTINTGLSLAKGARITVDNVATTGNPGGLVLQGRVSADGNLTKAGAGTMTMNNAVMAIGTSHGLAAETLDVNFEGVGALSLKNTTLEMDIFAGNSSDKLNLVGSLEGNSASFDDVHFVLNAPENTNFGGGTWDLLDWSNLNFTMTFSSDIANFFNLPTLGNGLTWNLDRFMSHGEISVVPEPSRALLLLFGLLAFLMRRRRSGIVLED